MPDQRVSIDDLDPAVFDQILDRLGALAQMNTLPWPLLRGHLKTVTADYTVLDADAIITANKAGTVTLTLPLASKSAERLLLVRTIQAQTVVSASANVQPLIGGAAGTGILAATAGKWALLGNDGTQWVIVASN